MSVPALLTAEEFGRINLPGKRTELVRGQMGVREPAGFAHGTVAMRIGSAIHQYVDAHNLGWVCAAETGFTIARGPDTVRAPDVSFIRADRLPSPLPRGFAELAPDLAVEVLSPDDRPGEVLEKVADWLNAGTLLVWVIDPVRRFARRYRADGSELHVSEGDALYGEGLLPGFQISLKALLR